MAMSMPQPLAPHPNHESMQVVGNNGSSNNTGDSDLRAQLSAVITTHQNTSTNPSTTNNHGQNRIDVYSDKSASPQSHEQHQQQQHHIDPAIAGGAQAHNMMNHQNNHSGEDDESAGGKGGKRELSQSKRAAQNRAAQRAFRQRKEGYIKKLEEQVREFNNLEESFKSIQTENYSLREYIIHLQSRLIESQGEFPQPPPNVNLSHPSRNDATGTIQMPTHHGDVGGSSSSAMGLGASAPTAPMGMSSQLQAQASAAAQAQSQAPVGVKRPAADSGHTYMNANQGPPPKRMRDEGRSEQPSNDLSRLVTGHDGLPTTLSMN